MSKDEEYTDDILFADEGDVSSMTKIDRVLNVLANTLQSEEFMDVQEAFAEKECEMFTPDGDLPPQAMSVYQNYVAMIEENLLSKIQEVDPEFDFQELIPVLNAGTGTQNSRYADVFEFLNAALDFDEFRALMASYRAGRSVDLSVQTTKLSP